MRNHWLFLLYVLPGSAVDVGTVGKVKEDLRDWRFSRDFFVGDAGMVSRASLRTPSQGGGKTLPAIPLIRPGACPVLPSGNVSSASRRDVLPTPRRSGKTPRRSPSSPACASSWPSSTPWFEQERAGMKRFLALDSEDSRSFLSLPKSSKVNFLSFPRPLSSGPPIPHFSRMKK